MEVAKILSEGETQLVALPKNFRFSDEEVFINRIGDAIILVPKEKTLSGMLAELDLFTEDFMNDGKKAFSANVRDVP